MVIIGALSAPYPLFLSNQIRNLACTVECLHVGELKVPFYANVIVHGQNYEAPA